MPTISIKPQQLSAALRGSGMRVRKAMGPAAHAASKRLQALIVITIDDKGITDLGVFKGSWRVIRALDGGASVFSDCPYAGVIELGARPHAVSKEGRLNIAAWAARKLGLDDQDAMRAAYFISKKIEIEGQEPTYLVRDLLPQARNFFGEELVRILNAQGGARA